MTQAYAWGAIVVVVLASSTGDVLLSHAMKQVGDVGALWRRTSLLHVAGCISRRRYSCTSVWIGEDGLRHC